MKFIKGSIRSSLYYSIVDGLFTAMMMGVSDAYLIPYGIALGASSAQIALLASVPMLVATMLQTHSARLTEHVGSRLKLINFVVFFHVLAWLPIIALPYLLPRAAHTHWAPWMLLAAVTVFASFGAFAVPAWQSLMSDYIPTKRRGAYFGWRNRLQGFFTVGVSVAAGLVLHYFGKDALAGFTVIFVFAMLCRFYAWVCLTRMREPYRHTTHDEYFSFYDFIRQIRTSNFAKFVLVVAMMTFSANLSGALLPAFLLKDLSFDYATYMMVVSTAALSGFVLQRAWGHYADRHGNIRALKIAGWGIAVTPLLWMVSRHPAWLFFVQLFAGAAWGGFNMLAVNFVLEAVSPAKRIRCLSYFNVTNAFAVFFGASLGGLLVHRLPPFQGYSYLTLFLLSCVCRAFVMVFAVNKVRDVRRPA